MDMMDLRSTMPLRISEKMCYELNQNKNFTIQLILDWFTISITIVHHVDP